MHPLGKLTTLRKQGEIRQVFGKGRRHRGRLINVVTLQQPESAIRALFVTSRKVGNAVTRNRVRRRLREAFRSLRRDIAKGCDVAIIASPAAANATYQELLWELRGRLTQAGLLS